MANVWDFAVAAVVSVPPTLVAIRNLRRIHKVEKAITIPHKRGEHPVHTRQRDKNGNGVTMGEELHEIREELYVLGELFGSHLVIHNPPLSLDDLDAVRHYRRKDDPKPEL